MLHLLHQTTAEKYKLKANLEDGFELKYLSQTLHFTEKYITKGGPCSLKSVMSICDTTWLLLNLLIAAYILGNMAPQFVNQNLS